MADTPNNKDLPVDLNFMMQQDNGLVDTRLKRAKEITDAFGPSKLSVECQGAMTDLDALAFAALLGAWKNNQNIIRTMVMTAYTLGKQVATINAVMGKDWKNGVAGESVDNRSLVESKPRLSGTGKKK